MPQISAAANHVMRPSIAFNITSFFVIAFASRATSFSMCFSMHTFCQTPVEADIFNCL